MAFLGSDTKQLWLALVHMAASEKSESHHGASPDLNFGFGKYFCDKSSNDRGSVRFG